MSYALLSFYVCTATHPRAIVELIAKHRAQFDEGFAKVGIVAIEIQALAMADDAASAEALARSESRASRRRKGSRASARKSPGQRVPIRLPNISASTKRTSRPTRSVLSSARLLRKRNTMRSDSTPRSFLPSPATRTISRLLPKPMPTPGTTTISCGSSKPTRRSGGATRESRGTTHGSSSTAAASKRRLPRLANSAAPLRGATSTSKLPSRSKPAIGRRLPIPSRLSSKTHPNSSAAALIQAAHLAQASGQGRLLDLIDAAVAKGGDDPNVLIGAYTLVLEEGLDEREDEAHDWFRRALDLSGSDGPIKQFELKDLLSQQAEWSEHSRAIGDAVAGGEMPLLVAAPGLRATLVDVLLGNLVRNAAATDSRKRSAITTFSGRRAAPVPIGAAQRLALDISAVMVLGWLGLLPKRARRISRDRSAGRCSLAKCSRAARAFAAFRNPASGTPNRFATSLHTSD